jgi:hypothetical protein
MMICINTMGCKEEITTGTSGKDGRGLLVCSLFRSVVAAH